MSNNTFNGFGIAPSLLEILERNHYIEPTPIQRQSILPGLEGKDIIGIAQTGTGKTLAFGIPMIQRIATHGLKGLVVLPTRELAIQVDETLQKIGKSLGLRTAILIGGESMQKQINQLKRKPHIIIATPGRLIDHVEQKLVALDAVKVLVLDEADRMFDMGFSPQIHKILNWLPKPDQRQTMLFSATMPDGIVALAARHMALPVRVEVAPAGSVTELVEHEIFIVKREAKMDLLETLLREHKGSVLVFSRTKHGATKIAQWLKGSGESVTELHSNKSLAQRRQALDGFKTDRYRVLIATDIAARGIDVANIELVINFDLPSNSEDYVHRIGRTGRAGNSGKAISLATPDEQTEIRSIERLIQKTITVTRHDSVSPELLAIQKHVRRRLPMRTQQRRPSFGASRPQSQSRGRFAPSRRSR